MNRKVSVILGIAVSVLTLVAIFVCFAAAFGDEAGGEEAGRGSVFVVMFGLGGVNLDAAGNYPPVAGLIIAFIFYCIGFVSAVVGTCFKGKLASICYTVSAATLVIGAILFCCIEPMYKASVPKYADSIGSLELGAGSLCAIIFGLAGGLLSAYGAWQDFKA